MCPASTPYDYYTKEYEKGLALYASGVMIMEKCADLLPDYFSFIKGVVDSEDLSLNISRETLQKDSQLKLIRNSLEKKIKNELHAMLVNDREKYETFWKSIRPPDQVWRLRRLRHAQRPAGRPADVLLRQGAEDGHAGRVHREDARRARSASTLLPVTTLTAWASCPTPSWC